jgi:dTDP-4-dehydrorhamnose 3,5-epimerase
MIFNETTLPGVYLLEPEKRADHRGFFARTWCAGEFGAHGLTAEFVQRNLSVNPVKGTLRGIHYQAAPYQEDKLVSCTRGAIFDVVVDLRPASPTYLCWYGAELTDGNYAMLYVPKGFGHGFQSLTDDCEVNYLVSEAYHPDAGRGVRADDPAINIRWPLEVTRISEQDLSWPLLDHTAYTGVARAASPSGDGLQMVGQA